MAKVTELKYGSREGSTWSMSEPASGTVRVFTVVVDDGINDDPRVTLRTTAPEGTGQTLVNEGSAHPWDSNLYARDFAILGRINTVTWTVSVAYYNLELTATTWNGWTPQVHTASVIERKYETFPVSPSDRFQPSPSGMALIFAWGKLHDGIKRVASLKYELAPEGPPAPGETASHWTYGPDGGRIDLIQTRARELRDSGFDWERPVVILTMDKDVQSVPRNYAFWLALYKSRVNSQTFLPQFMGIPAGHCMFKDGAVTVVDGSPPGLPNAGKHYHVQCVFIVSGAPLSFVRKIHTFEMDGAVTPVFRSDTNKLQNEDFKQALQTDLNGLLTKFV